MAGAVFQIETKDFSLPGRLGRLLGGMSLPPGELLDHIAGCGQTMFLLPAGEESKRARVSRWFLSTTALGKVSTETPLVGKGNIVGGCLLPEMKTE